MREVTFRTRKAAQKWRFEFGRTVEPFPTLMIRREGNEILFSRTRVVWILEIPEALAPLAASFFPQQVINQ